MTDEDLRTSLTLLGKLCDSRDGEAWQRFMKRYHRLIYVHARQLVGDPTTAEDITGEVLLKIARALPEFHYDPAQSFRAWLRTVVRNACRDWARRQAHAPHFQQLDASAWLDVPDSEVSDAADGEPQSFVDGVATDVHQPLQRDLQLVRGAMQRVRERVKKPQRWHAYWAAVMEGKKAAEVAQELGLSVNDVFVAKNQIGKMLREEVLVLLTQRHPDEEATP